MSKPKPKDKKNDNISLIETQYENQKRQLLEATFTVKKLQQKLTTLTTQNLMLHQELTNQRREYDEKLQQLNIKEEASQQDLSKTREEKTQLQIANISLDSKIKYLEKQLEIENITKNKELEELRNKMNFQVNKYQYQLTEYNHFMKVKKNLEDEIWQLNNKMELEKIAKDQQIADKEREKVQATDKLRDEMSKKTRQMKTNLLSLKKEQLSTTTRLTILQNHQLTSELQYQSKQTEKLIFKNEQLQAKVNVLNRDLQIHKEVQQQLAKRSHISKGVIKKLNARVCELQQEVLILKKQEIAPNLTENNPKSQNMQYLSTLDRQLTSSQNKLTQLTVKYQIVLKQNQSLTYKLKRYESNYNKIANILEKQIQEFNLNSSDMPNHINVAGLKDKEVENWDNNQRIFVINMLLNVIQPYLNKKTLNKENEDKQHSLPKVTSERPSKDEKGKIKNMPIAIASKIVASNLRQWGKTVEFTNKTLKRKYKLSQSYRS